MYNLIITTFILAAPAPGQPANVTSVSTMPITGFVSEQLCQQAIARIQGNYLNSHRIAACVKLQ
jgi:hypothetical protein